MDNIAWMFSGIGVALLALLLSPLRKYFLTWLDTLLRFIPFVERRQLEAWAGENNFKANPTPRVITSEVKRHPPAQRQYAEDHYKGLKVVWSVKFVAIDPYEDGRAKLTILAGMVYPWVSCEVFLDDYPQLKIYRENQILWIAGTISCVRGHCIALADVKLRLF